jgi:hypothetical protein
MRDCSSAKAVLSGAQGGLIVKRVAPRDSPVIPSSLTQQPSGSGEHGEDQACSRNSKHKKDHHSPLLFP